jgi:hypothetical protein
MQTETAGNPAMMATEEERKKIVSVFKDNDELLKSIRAVLLNLNPTGADVVAVRGLGPEVKKIIKDRFLPELDKETPIGQIKDSWLGAEQMIFGQHRDAIAQAVGYKGMAIKMTREALKLLDGEDGPVSVNFNPDIANDPLGIKLMARNQFIRHVESQLFALHVIANQKQETPVQAAKRAHKDSMQ